MNHAENGIYYFLGNITSHVIHALPLWRELGGTFIVLSEKSKKDLIHYKVPVINIDNKPYKLKRYGPRLKKIHEYLDIDDKLKKSSDFLNKNASVVVFYELYDLSPSVQITKPKTIFLTHGNMLKDYMANADRLRVVKQYDYMAALGPATKKKLIMSGVPTKMLVDLGIARTDEITANAGKVIVPNTLASKLGIDSKKPIFAYLPTFWGPSSIYDTGLEILKNFPEKYTLIFRPHPQTPKKLLAPYFKIINSRDNLVYAPETKLELTKLIAAASAIIGDVSSVMLDAILLDKPLIFAYGEGEHRQAASDYETIKDIVDYSQKIEARNIAKLDQTLADALEKGIDKKIWQATKSQTFYNRSGDSAKAIAHFIRSII